MLMRRLAGFSSALVIAVLVPGCWTPFVYDRCWAPAWRWASHDGGVTFVPPGTAVRVTLVPAEDRLARPDELAIGFRRADLQERARAVREAREDGRLAASEEPIGCWEMDPGWPGAEGPFSGLIAATDSWGASRVLVRGAKGWRSCEVVSACDGECIVFRQAAVATGMAPVWVVGFSLDAASIVVIAGGFLFYFVHPGSLTFH
jgi:hypothetical protein